MSDVIGASCAVSGYEYCCLVQWSVCICVCGLILMARLRPIRFYLSMAADVVEQWASSDTHLFHMDQNPHFVSGMAGRMKINWGDIYWLMMSPAGNGLEGYHSVFFGKIITPSVPQLVQKINKKPTPGLIFNKVCSGTIMHSAKCSLNLITLLLCA